MRAEHRGISIERPGHATIKVTLADGRVIYFDPFEHVLSGAPGDADIVLCSHAHPDHFDPQGIDAVSSDGTTIRVYEAIDADEIPSARPLESGETDAVDGIEVETVPAYNRPDGTHVRSNGEPYHPDGDGVGFVVTANGTTLYFCGDTDALPELAALDADVVFPPIGGGPTMNRTEAAAFVTDIDPNLVVPVHYDSPISDSLDTDAEAFKAAVEAEGIRVELL